MTMSPVVGPRTGLGCFLWCTPAAKKLANFLSGLHTHSRMNNEEAAIQSKPPFLSSTAVECSMSEVCRKPDYAPLIIRTGAGIGSSTHGRVGHLSRAIGGVLRYLAGHLGMWQSHRPSPLKSYFQHRLLSSPINLQLINIARCRTPPSGVLFSTTSWSRHRLCHHLHFNSRHQGRL